MKSVEKHARTVEEALELALIALNATEDEVDVEVLEKDSSGFLGLFGGREAHIRVTLREVPEEEEKKSDDVFAPENVVLEELQQLGIEVDEPAMQKEEQDPKEFLAEFLEDLLQKMYLDATVDIHEGVDGLEAIVDGEDMSLLIGRRGRTLDALQYITNLVFNRKRDEYIHVLVDSQNYRAKRRDTLEQMARRMAEKAKRQRKDIILHPMNAYERRIVHSALQKDPHVSTRSEGKDPNRQVIIFLNR